MKKMTTKLPAGKIVEIKELSDGTFEVVQEMLSGHNVVSDDAFILVEAERLSLNDEFMNHKSRTKRERKAKELIAEAIRNKVKNFYRPIMDPSFTEDGICYVAGKMPAVGKSYNWWTDVAKNYNPSRNSRLGTRLEYGAFLGVLIKKLVEEGKSIEWAWNAVCNDSKELGHYWNSSNSKGVFEFTGARCICGFCDLANTCKVLAEDFKSDGFWAAAAHWGSFSYANPLADLCYSSFCDRDYHITVGWIVLS